MNDLLQKLKDNEKPFGLMSEEMQAKAREIGPECFEAYITNTANECRWHTGVQGKGFGNNCQNAQTYRLRPDYTEDEGVKKCGIYEGSHGKLWFNHGKSGAKTINGVEGYTNFIGYLYENDAVSASPRRYRNDICCRDAIGPNELESGTWEAEIPTHVLFRK